MTVVMVSLSHTLDNAQHAPALSVPHNLACLARGKPITGTQHQQ
jgi:hypothetical protein